jgi:hypothetical protein
VFLKLNESSFAALQPIDFMLQFRVLIGDLSHVKDKRFPIKFCYDESNTKNFFELLILFSLFNATWVQ